MSPGAAETLIAEGCPACSTLELSYAKETHKLSQRAKTVTTAVIALLVVLFAFFPKFEESGPPMDEGMLLVYPEMLLHGKLPYRDFETFYGPGSPALFAGIFALTGPNLTVERAVGLLYRALILLAIFALALPSGRVLGAGCLFIAGFFLLGTGVPAYVWLGAMALALWSFWLSQRTHSPWACLFAGLLAGLSLLFRPDIAPAVILGSLPLLGGMNWPNRARYFCGGAIGLLPLAALTLVIGWRPLFDNLFLGPVILCNPARRLPLFTAEPYVLSLFFFHLLAVALNLSAGIILLRSSEEKTRGRLLLCLALFGLGLTYQAAQRLDAMHLILVAFISLGLLPVSLAVIASRFTSRKLTTGEALGTVLVVLVIVHLFAPEQAAKVRDSYFAGWRTETAGFFAENAGRSFAVRGPQMAAANDHLFQKLDALSKPGDRLFVGPADLRRTNYNDTYFYYLLPQLTPATYFLEMNPLSANRPNSRLATDVRSADWLLLDRSLDYWSEPNRSVEYASNEPNLAVHANFDLIDQIGPYLLLRRKGLPTVRRETMAHF